MRNGPTRGSSPLTRGKRAPGRGCRHRRGLIPAHAGKTSGQGRARSRRRAHPRSRGENVVCFCAPSAVQGSSPLTRGKPDLRVGGLCRLRLIPAHAGKTRSPGTPIIVPGAHPRSRGENIIPGSYLMRPPGSSPLTRGKRADHTMPTRLAGLIPAHAGKTVLCRLVWPCWWAHPRSRGENRITPLASRKYHGSSPLTRGKLHVFPEHLRTGRLIPAHAGKTRSAGPRRGSSRAHPRSRGENDREGKVP